MGADTGAGRPDERPDERADARSDRHPDARSDGRPDPRSDGRPGSRGGARLKAIRWVGAGLIDQVVIASANAANTLLAAILLPRDRAGIMIVSVNLAYLVVGLNRAFVGDVLLALAARYDGERRAWLVRRGLGTAVINGLAGSVLFAVTWAVWPTGGKIDLRDLVWLTPFLPLILLHDTGRSSYLSDRQPAKALVIDAVWVSTQAVLVVAMIATGRSSAPGLLLAWGIGATAGATVFLVRTKARPRPVNPRRWFAETRFLSGWFTATAVIGQFQTQAVVFLVTGLLSKSALTGLRTAQTALLQPVQNFVTAVQGLLVPRLSRLAGDAERLPGTPGEEAAAGLKRQTRLVSLTFVALALVTVGVLWPVAQLALTHIRKFADIAPLALPISLQAGIYIVQVPFTAALRGMHQARLIFAQYSIFTTTSLTGLILGAALGGLTAAAWGLAIGSAVGLVVMITLYLRSMSLLRPAREPGR